MKRCINCREQLGPQHDVCDICDRPMCTECYAEGSGLCEECSKGIDEDDEYDDPSNMTLEELLDSEPSDADLFKMLEELQPEAI